MSNYQVELHRLTCLDGGAPWQCECLDIQVQHNGVVALKEGVVERNTEDIVVPIGRVGRQHGLEAPEEGGLRGR